MSINFRLYGKIMYFIVNKVEKVLNAKFLIIFFITIIFTINNFGGTCCDCCGCCNEENSSREIEREIDIEENPEGEEILDENNKNENDKLIDKSDPIENGNLNKDFAGDKVLNKKRKNTKVNIERKETIIEDSLKNNVKTENNSKPLKMLKDMITMPRDKNANENFIRKNNLEVLNKKIKKMENENNWDEYENLFKAYEKTNDLKKVLDNPFSILLKLYDIIENRYVNFFDQYYKADRAYKDYLKGVFTSGYSASIFNYMSDARELMYENINKIGRLNQLAKKLDGTINKSATKNKVKSKKIVLIDVGDIGEGNYLQDEEVISMINYNLYFDTIRDCFYKLLDGKRINQKPLSLEDKNYIERLLNDCFSAEEIEIKGNKKIKIDDKLRDIILETFYDICNFHNLTFLVLAATNAQNSIYAGNINIKHNYKKVGRVLNLIHDNIIARLNQYNSKNWKQSLT